MVFSSLGRTDFLPVVSQMCIRDRDKEKFRRYFKEACHRIGETEVFYQFKFNKKIQKVPLKDIVYLSLIHI